MIFDSASFQILVVITMIKKKEVKGSVISSYLSPAFEQNTEDHDEVVFCIHGRPGNHSLMKSFNDWAVQTGRGFYCYDQYSESSVEGAVDIELDSDSLLGLFAEEFNTHIQPFRQKKLLIVAHSFGGVILCEYVRRFGDSLAGVQIVFSGFCPDRIEFLDYNTKRIDLLKQQYSPEKAEQVFTCQHICNPADLNEEQDAAMNSVPFGKVDIKDSYLHELSIITAECFYTYGEHDICSTEQINIASNVLSGCISTMIQGASHYPFISHGAAYFEKLNQMFGKQDKAV